MLKSSTNAALSLCILAATVSCGDAHPEHSNGAQQAPRTEASVESIEGPFDPAAEIRPDVIQAVPTSIGPGDLVELHFPEETERLIAYVLEAREGDGWELRYYLTARSEANDGEPDWTAAQETFSWVDLPVHGAGPDVVRIPPRAAPGEHRICTAASQDSICALVQIREF
jgi:hypothetical protein